MTATVEQGRETPEDAHEHILTEATDNPSIDDAFDQLIGRVEHVWLPAVEADVEYVTDTLSRLARCATPAMKECIDAEQTVDLIRKLEELTGVLAGAHARLAVVLDAHTRDAQADMGVPAGKRGAGVPSQLGLARRESPTRAAMHLGLAKALVTELPATMAALAAGETTEYRAMLVARATAVLDPNVRRQVDAIIGPELVGLSDRATESRAKALAYTADPHAFAAACERSAAERYVSIRPAPTAMARLSGCVPAADGVACWAALDSAARSMRAAGDERTLAQLRSDVMVERLTGRNPVTDGPDIEVGIIITDQALFGESMTDDAAQHGPDGAAAPAEPHGDTTGTTGTKDGLGADTPEAGTSEAGSSFAPTLTPAGTASRAGEAAYIEGVGPVPA
ncbi:MAG: DUF222 domain-containing protein, partial [Mobilicoccus sp.]|nr:DUF222 domain-containing protein [Mobilicoccus sp.]